MSNLIAYLVNAIGLILEIWGVVIVFRARDIGLPVPKLVKAIYPDAHKGDYSHAYLEGRNLYDILQEMQDNINKTNESNRLIYRRSKRGLFLIILGFLLSLSSTLLFLAPLLQKYICE